MYNYNHVPTSIKEDFGTKFAYMEKPTMFPIIGSIHK